MEPTAPNRTGKKSFEAVPEVEILVTAQRSKETERESPRSLNVITERRLSETNPITVLDALKDQPGIWVLKRTATTSRSR